MVGRLAILIILVVFIVLAISVFSADGPQIRGVVGFGLSILFWPVVTGLAIRFVVRKLKKGHDRTVQVISPILDASTAAADRPKPADNAPQRGEQSEIETPIGPRVSIFVSYRRQESGDITGRIYDHLVRHFGREAIFKDVDSIPLGVDFRKVLGDAVGRCDLLLAVIGREWLTSQDETGSRRLQDPRDFVRIEIEAALQRSIPVIPLLVQGATVPDGKELPPSVQALVYRNAISIRPDPDFHNDVDRLIKGIEQHVKNI